ASFSAGPRSGTLTMSDAVDLILQALHASPTDETAWLALADSLEEADEPDRAELTRLAHRLRTDRGGEDRPVAEPRVQEMVGAGVRPCVPIRTNALGMRFALIPPGSFLMGSPEDEDHRSGNEGPLHEVRITRPFYLGVTQVTQEQYRKVMDETPSRFSVR